jgi:hypothetical protein
LGKSSYQQNFPALMDRNFGQEDFMGRKIFRTKAELGGALVDIRKFVDVEESWQSKGHLNRHRAGNWVQEMGA